MSAPPEEQLEDSIRPTAPLSDAEEAVFSVENSSIKDVNAASRRRTQSKPYKVVCPMCETVGYIPTALAGKEIRCANPKCMVPVFVAPKIQKKKIEEAPPPKSSSSALVASLLGGVLLVVGLAIWYFQSQQPQVSSSWDPASSSKVPPPKTVAPTKQPAQDKAGRAEPPVVPKEKPLTLVEVRDDILKKMGTAARDENRNYNPPYCDRVTAETAADCGDLKTAGEFLDHLEKDKDALVFYRVSPLTSIALLQLKQKDRQAAVKSLDDALVAAKGLPDNVRFSVDMAGRLAEALVAAGRDQDARELLSKHPATGQSGRLFSAMSSAAAWKSWNVEAAQRDRSLLDVSSLQYPAVVEATVARGYPTESLRFAQGLAGAPLQAECLIAWGEAAARWSTQRKSTDSSNTDLSRLLEPVLKQLQPAAKARLYARLGTVQRTSDRSAAEKHLQLALETLGNVAARPEAAMPSWKEIYSPPHHDPAPARQEALALAEIARLEAALNKKQDAQKHLDEALNSLRASAPSPVAVKLKLSQMQKDKSPALRSEMSQALGLRDDGEARIVRDKCIHNCKQLLAAAESRFNLQVEILETACIWDDLPRLWKAVRERADDPNPARAEPYFSTALPWQIAIKLLQSGDQAAATAILEALKSHEAPAAARLDYLAALPEKVNVNDLVRGMEKVDGADRADREWAVLARVNALVHAEKVKDAFTFVRLFKDRLLKEEMLEWTAALACRSGFQRKTMDVLNKETFISTESVSAWRGFLLGLTAFDPDSN